MKMLPHVFTQSEMSDLAIDLASATQRKEAIEDRKKEANSQFKAEIDVPASAQSTNFFFFYWNQPGKWFEIRNFKVEPRL